MNKMKECRYGPMIYSTEQWIGRSLDLYGEAHQQELEFIEKFIGPEDVVFDIGAHVGHMTIPLSKKANHVYSFEFPHFNSLCGNVALNNLTNVKLATGIYDWTCPCDFMRVSDPQLFGFSSDKINSILIKHKPLLFITTNPWSMPVLSEMIKNANYVSRTCKFNYFNPKNFFGNPVDELRQFHEPDIPMMSAHILCYHKDVQEQMDVKYFKAIKDMS